MRVTVPHNLGKDEARRRLQAKGGDIGAMIPGGLAKVTTDWADQDHMKIAVNAMGQSATATATVEDSCIIVTLDLPPALGFFARPIEKAIAQGGQKLLAAR